MMMITSGGALESARAVATPVDGWLTDAEGVWLFHAARQCKDAIVELGSWKGRSTVWLGRGSLDGNRAPVFAVDPHTGSDEHREQVGPGGTFPKFTENIARANVDAVVRPMVTSSAAASYGWRDPIGLLFVDASHAYEAIADDLRRWSPHVVDGGWIAVHDSSARPGIYWATGWPGPMRATRELVLRATGFACVELVDTMLVARRARGATIPRTQQLTIDLQRQGLRMVHRLAHGGGKVLPEWARYFGKRLLDHMHR